MKRIISCAVVAFYCCGSSASYAQIRILDEQQPASQRYIAQSGVRAKVGTFPNAEPHSDSIPNPFDLTPRGTQPGVPQNYSQGSSRRSAASPSDQILGNQVNNGQTNVADPRSLPVNRPARDVVDTILDYSVVQGLPDARTTPINWGQSMNTPNPVAEILLRQYCTQGLWAGYPAQRAAECAAMYEKLAGHHRCGGCGHCGGCGGHCGPAMSAGPCSVCSGHGSCGPVVRNRYLERLLQKSCKSCGSSSCSGCDAPACDTGCGCADCVGSQTIAPPPALPVSVTSEEVKRDNVAALPSSLFR